MGKQRKFTKAELEEHDHAVHVDRVLRSIYVFLEGQGADDEMLATVEYLIDDNASWINSDLVGRERPAS